MTVERVRRAVPYVVLAVLLVLTVTQMAAGATQADDRGLVITGTIDDHDIATADSDEPIPIDPKRRIPVDITIRNVGDQTEDIRYVRLEGKALGLTFLTYDLGVRATLQPNDRTEVVTFLEFFDLESQATGYLGTSLRVYDSDGFVIGERPFVVDVLGRTNSTLGGFAIIVFGLAAFSTAVIVVNTVRRRLPANRFIRAMQFAMAGSAIGVTLSISVSVLRIGFAEVEDWVRIVTTPTAIAFVLGYLAPGPLQRSIRDHQAEEALTAAAQVAVARSSGVNPVVAEEAMRSLQRSGRLPTGDSPRWSRRSIGNFAEPPDDDVRTSRK